MNSNKDKAFNSIILSAGVIAVYSFLVKVGQVNDDYELIIYGLVGTYFVLNVKTYFIKDDESIGSVPKSKSDDLMESINKAADEKKLDVEEDLHEIGINEREKAEAEENKFNIDSISDIKDDKPEPSKLLKEKLAFKSSSIGDIDFKNVEEEALKDLSAFEKDLID